MGAETGNSLLGGGAGAAFDKASVTLGRPGREPLKQLAGLDASLPPGVCVRRVGPWVERKTEDISGFDAGSPAA